MAERTGYHECTVCNKLFTTDQLESIPDGYGIKLIQGPRSPLGWSKVSERRRVRFIVTKRVCFNCLGYDKPPKPQSSEKHAMACEFKRFFPPQR